MSRRPVLRPVESDQSPPDESVPVVDYSHLWAPPPPVPPPRPRLGVLIALAVLFVLALCLAVLAGDGDLQGRQN
jgi:hypothetical protein